MDKLKERASISEALAAAGGDAPTASCSRAQTLRVDADCSGLRLDQALSRLYPEHSRVRWQAVIRAGGVHRGGAVLGVRDAVYADDVLVVEPGAAPAPLLADAPQDLPLAIVHEDTELLVIDKPAGLVVHPAAGNPAGTLVNALLHHDPALAMLPRAGLVHRLDKDTSGLLLVARTAGALQTLTAALQARHIEREYQAVVFGVPTGGGTIEAPIGRHPRERERQAVIASGRPARTHYRVRERFRGHAWLTVKLDTGRTHQIRVHMSHIGYPIVGDPVYGGRARLPRGPTAGLIEALRDMRRQALHASRLALVHPATQAPLAFESPLPADFAALLAALRADAGLAP